MPEFYDFVEYLKQHKSEMAYDAVKSVRPFLTKELPNYDFDEDFLLLIARISEAQTISVLRQYHAWLSQIDR